PAFAKYGEEFSLRDFEGDVAKYDVAAKRFGNFADAKQCCLRVGLRVRGCDVRESVDRSHVWFFVPTLCRCFSYPSGKQTATTALPSHRSKSRCTWRGAAHSARNKSASGSCRRRPDAGSSPHLAS